MGLIQKLFKRKPIYDVNVPIKEYTEQQIRARIKDELGKLALNDYKTIHISYDRYVSENILKVVRDDVETRSLIYEYFLNNFFAEAVRLKLKRVRYEYIQKHKETTSFSKENVQKMLDEIDEIVDKTIAKAKKEVEKREQIARNNEEEMPKIEELFSDIINTNND